MASQPHHYNRKNICFLLLEDSKVFIYNYLSKQVVAIFQPPVLSHDFAICFTLHHSGLNIATASKSGQIFFWELNTPVLEAIERS
jgi:WD40 repeat protein